MATQVATTPDVLLLAVQTQVIAFTGLPNERVVIDAREDDEDVEIAQAEQYVVLRVETGLIVADNTVSAGRFCVIERLNFSATLWTRLVLDESTRGDLLMTSASLGHLKQRANLYDALIDFLPTDSSSNALASEPIKPARSGRPRRPRNRAGWARSALDFVMPYQLLLTLGATKDY